MKKVFVMFLWMMFFVSVSANAAVSTAQDVKKAAKYSNDNFKKEQVAEYPKIKLLADNKKIKVSASVKATELQTGDNKYYLITSFNTRLKNNDVLSLKEIIDENGVKFNNEYIYSNTYYNIGDRILIFITLDLYGSLVREKYDVNFVIEIPEQYLISHKDNGISLKAYTTGGYGDVSFIIPSFYIQGILEK
ncbi:MAG: hypothetical protein LBQ37_00580 [Elusimicrobiota bacterium]|jgi:hypothetical protein|nr:hypothetical protein [Elusimicrobiota bacterium]